MINEKVVKKTALSSSLFHVRTESEQRILKRL